MKRIRILCLSLVLLLMVSSCENDTQSEIEVKLPDHRNPSLYQTNLVSATQEFASLFETAPIYEGEIEIDPSYQLVRGNLQTYFVNNEDTPLSEIYFRLFPNYNGGEYHLEDIKIGGEETTWELASQDTALRIELLQPLEQGEELSVQLSFSLSIPVEMGGNYDIFGYDKDILALDNLLPSIPVYDENGWHVDYPASNGDLPFLDSSFYHLIITAPEELVIVSSGMETVTNVNQETNIQTVEIIAGPIRDFYLSASPLYSVETIDFDDTAINCYAIPGYTTNQSRILEIAQNTLSLLSDHLGAYPYTEFDIVASPVSSAMEYPGIIAVGLDTFIENSASANQTLADFLIIAIVHETAHQWFYNMVGSDQINQPWLDESFAQYLTHLYFQEIEGSSSAFDIMIGKSWSRINREKIPIGMPVLDYQRSNYFPIIYSRGMSFLLKLEDQLGEELFATVLKDYFQTYLWHIAGPDDFRNIAETKCECDLSDLWREWVLP
ncbi:MAG: M1 family metallopeptidase [Anaerolineales bacterium]